MKLEISIPVAIFPAISLLMLAYTNRFLTIAGLIRELVEEHNDQESDNVLLQITNLQERLKIIRLMQIWGALAFTMAILSMLLLLADSQLAGTIVFIIALLFLLVSLFYLVYELHISVNALTMELNTIKKEKDK